MTTSAGAEVVGATTSGRGAARVDPRSAFVDLVLADAELVYLEFEAIVEAGWGGDALRPPAPRGGADRGQGARSVVRPPGLRAQKDLVIQRSVLPHERGPP